ncbi:hypothetical protein CF651_16405 [Paenibacillus rigui]|uniref:Uncharacterized protein n=1 Tax=Paenibacillus rigui TaxID=554312 RepID=A0A229UP51_9BACL|nr:hypothetical protein CF651_16405 [Paenibacillus rigui]
MRCFDFQHIILRFLDRTVIAGVQVERELSLELTDRLLHIFSKARVHDFSFMVQSAVSSRNRFILYNAKQPAGCDAVRSPYSLIIIFAVSIC